MIMESRNTVRPFIVSFFHRRYITKQQNAIGKKDKIIINKYIINIIYCFGGLGVACWPLVPKFAGSNLAEAVGFLRAKKSSARLRSEGK